MVSSLDNFGKPVEVGFLINLAAHSLRFMRLGCTGDHEGVPQRQGCGDSERSRLLVQERASYRPQ